MPPMPSADIVFDALLSFQRSAALKSAIDLNLFTLIDEGARTVSALAQKCGAPERGIRILCDYLTIQGLLEKQDGAYQLVPESAAFLSRRSPAYLGTTTQFLLRPEMTRNFDHLTETIRRGVVAQDGNTVSDANPVWEEFARAMVPMMMPAAQAIPDLLGVDASAPLTVLDIAASHGMFGISIAQRLPQARVVAVDWESVLLVAKENAERAGVSDRLRLLPGDAFKVDFGTGYDVALVTNFLHHFDKATCTAFLKKVFAALEPDGRVVLLEFVPNPDRISPPIPASFSLTMLAGTPSGDAYTFDELRQQLEAAGFTGVTAHGLPTPQTLLIARRPA
jgi:2-polyprenyl-3-methyl-5-hydroxy-6-metoxy-1,4-benzoquinol methylase